MDIETRVLLLGIYKRKDSESLNDVLMILEDAGVFTYKDGKKKLKNLKEEGYIIDNKLTVVGMKKAEEIEQEFKI
jgi:hypothetical protein